MESVSKGATPYAVVDCETTGIHPSYHHRIIELAIINVESDGKAVECWSSLLRAERDLGPTGIHGIYSRDLRSAPTFDDVLGDVLERLAGRTLVAHNARFDCGFLEAELARVGAWAKPLRRLCTMELAAALGVGGARLRLASCAKSLDIKLADVHRAESDATACAGILSAYLKAFGSASADQLAKGQRCSPADWPTSDHHAPPRERGATPPTSAEPEFLASLVASSDTPLGDDMARVAPYIEVLDRAIEDRRLSREEQAELAHVAVSLGLSAARVRSLHEDYVGTLVAIANRDGVVTDRERQDLLLVGEALGLANVEHLMDRPPTDLSARATSPLKGQQVCFTGTLTCIHKGRLVTRQVATELAEAAGLTVVPRVTKTLDLLVTADPDSMSGKASKAREYGIRIVAEAAFWPMVGIEVN